MSRRDACLVAVAGLATLLPYLGQTRDIAARELRHAEIAREMAESGALLVPTLFGREYAEKPPVMHAMIAGLYRLAGGPSLTLARLPSVLAAVAGALAVYGVGVVLSGRQAALLAALALLGSFEYRHMARIARPDMIFAATILGSCLAVALALRAGHRDGRRRCLALGGSLAGLATVTKGPLGAVVPALFALLVPVRREDLRGLRVGEWTTFIGGLVALLGAWAACLWLNGHGGYLHRLLTQPDLAGSDPDPVPGYRYLSALLIGFLPFTTFLPLVVRDVRRRRYTAFVAVAIVLVLFLSVVPKKRPHYLLPIYPFLALAVAEAVTNAGARWIRVATTALIAGAIAVGPFYYAFTPPWPVSPEEPKLAMGRRVLALVGPDSPIVGMDELAEAIAFEGRRGGVSEATEVGDVVREALINGPGSYIALPEEHAEALLRAAAGRLDLTQVLVARLPVHRRERGWRLYRVDSVTAWSAGPARGLSPSRAP